MKPAASSAAAPPRSPIQVRRVAVIGTGMAARVHARSALRAGAESIGVLGSSVDRSHEAVESGNFAVAFGSIDELLAWRPDVVHICTPNAMHAPYARAALEAGAHVVCEKPLGLDLEEARDLERLASHVGAVATVPFVYRFHPIVREIRSRVRKGEVGEIVLIHGTYLQDWMLDPTSSNWRVDPALGGASRAFADIGSHWCDLIEFVTGERLASAHALLSVTPAARPTVSTEPFGVESARDAPRTVIATEDAALVQFLTSTGIPVSTVISQVSAGRKNRLWFEIDGTRTSMIFDQENPESMRIGSRDGMLAVRRGEGSPSAGQTRFNRLPAGHAQGWEDAFAAFVADTYAAIAGAIVEGLPTFTDGARSAAIVEAVLESAKERAWVEIDGGSP